MRDDDRSDHENPLAFAATYTKAVTPDHGLNRGGDVIVTALPAYAAAVASRNA